MLKNTTNMRAFWNKLRRVNVPKADDTVKISKEKPPIWNEVTAAFKINPTAYFTYGDTIYNPSELPLFPEIIEHEKVHMKQQKHNDTDAALWWGRYLREPKFRIDQEARAYARQYEIICGAIKDRNERNLHLLSLAGSLSGPLYNNAVSMVEATALIKQHANIKK